jgi:Family of unknown function (DUF6445)
VILPTVTVHCIGEEREPVAVIENFAPEPLALREHAITCRFNSTDDHYPGLKAPVAADYLAQQWPILAPIFKEVFGVSGKVSVLDATYALVTTPPEALTLEQRLPHVDALAPGRLALIHYLVPEGSDGTAFYRHRRSGFETIDRTRSDSYFAQLNDDLHTHGLPPPAYLNGSNAIFEQTGHFDGRHNRALVYRGRLLHSGAIAAGDALIADPGHGRLTITGFFAAD